MFSKIFVLLPQAARCAELKEEVRALRFSQEDQRRKEEGHKKEEKGGERAEMGIQKVWECGQCPPLDGGTEAFSS